MWLNWHQLAKMTNKEEKSLNGMYLGIKMAHFGIKMGSN